MSKFAKPLNAVFSFFSNSNAGAERAENAGRLSALSDVQLARMGLNRAQIIHSAFSGYHYS